MRYLCIWDADLGRGRRKEGILEIAEAGAADDGEVRVVQGGWEKYVEGAEGVVGAGERSGGHCLCRLTVSVLLCLFVCRGGGSRSVDLCAPPLL